MQNKYEIGQKVVYTDVNDFMEYTGIVKHIVLLYVVEDGLGEKHKVAESFIRPTHSNPAPKFVGE
jgi:hypothetical protein